MWVPTEIAIYLRNGTRQAPGCYGTLIESGRLIVKWTQWSELRCNSRGQIFQVDLLNNAHTQNDQIRQDNTRGKGRSYRGQPQPNCKGRGPVLPKFGVTLLFMHTPLTQNYQIWHDNTYREGHVFRGQSRPIPRRRSTSTPHFWSSLFTSTPFYAEWSHSTR